MTDENSKVFIPTSFEAKQILAVLGNCPSLAYADTPTRNKVTWWYNENRKNVYCCVCDKTMDRSLLNNRNCPMCNSELLPQNEILEDDFYDT